MPNNQAEDRYDPPSATVFDFDELKFRDVPVEEIFWLNNSMNWRQNTAHRKVDENNGMNTKTRQVSNVPLDVTVYQKI